METLPSTQDALLQHCKQVVYQAAFGAFVCFIPILLLTDLINYVLGEISFTKNSILQQNIILLNVN